MEAFRTEHEAAASGKLRRLTELDGTLSRFFLLSGVALLTYEVLLRETQRPAGVAVGVSIVLSSLGDALHLGKSKLEKVVWKTSLSLCGTACILRLLWD